MRKRLIVNADDFGVSPGVNEAILAAHKNGVLNSASIIVNASHSDQAFRIASENPALRVGVHLNLTRQQNQKPLADPAAIPLLVNDDGLMRHGFAGLLKLSFLKSAELRIQAEREMRAQIDRALSAGIRPAHLDSHRHVHAIPALFQAVRTLADEYGIPRIRVVNESLAATLKGKGGMRGFVDGGLIKYFVLRTLFRFNRAESSVYYYSIFHTTRLFGENVGKVSVPDNYSAVELCTHPGVFETDRREWNESFNDYLLSSPNRQKEYEALLDKRLPERFIFSDSRK